MSMPLWELFWWTYFGLNNCKMDDLTLWMNMKFDLLMIEFAKEKE